MFFVNEKLYVGNIGDSRIIASKYNGKEIVELTRDHKPGDMKEKQRIESNGGEVKKS